MKYAGVVRRPDCKCSVDCPRGVTNVLGCQGNLNVGTNERVGVGGNGELHILFKIRKKANKKIFIHLNISFQ